MRLKKCTLIDIYVDLIPAGLLVVLGGALNFFLSNQVKNSAHLQIFP